MLLGTSLGIKNVQNNPTSTNYVGYSPRNYPHIRSDIVQFPHLLLRVAEENERQLVVLREFSVGVWAVRAYTDYLGIQALENIVTVTEATCLLCAAHCLILRIEVEDDVLFSSKLGQ